jgi:hypothetical protein
VELLVQKFKEEPEQEGDIYIPEYQRKLRWTDQAQSYFIESVIPRPAKRFMTQRSEREPSAATSLT